MMLYGVLLGQDSSSFNRHTSVDSVNSYNSLMSQQTTTTANTSDADKKKKRKNWVRCVTELCIIVKTLDIYQSHYLLA